MPPGEKGEAGAAPGQGVAAITTVGKAEEGDGPDTTTAGALLRPLPTLVDPTAAAAAAAAEAGPRYPHSEYDAVSLWQLLTFSFVTPVVKQGLRKPLQQEDVEEVARTDRAALVTDALEAAWEAELARFRRQQQEAAAAGGARGARAASVKPPSLWRAIYKSRVWPFWWSAFLLLVEAAVMLAKPVLLRFFISWLQGKAPAGSPESLQRAARGGLGYGYGFAAGLALLDCLQLVLHHASFYVTIHEGGRLKNAVTGLVYRKILRLGSQWQSKASTGQIVAIVSNDAQRYEEFTTSLHFVWIAPMNVIVGTGLLMLYVGWKAALVGAAATVGAMPLQVICGGQVGTARRRTALITDRRVRLMAEVLAGIQSVKAFCWEGPFLRKIAAAREQERASLAWAGLMRALTMAVFFFAPSLAAFATFVTVWAQGDPLELSTVFAAMSILQVLREAARWIPRSIEQVSEAHVATTRIQPLLMMPEVGAGGQGQGQGQQQQQVVGAAMQDREEAVLTIEDSDFCWDGSSISEQKQQQKQQQQHHTKQPQLRHVSLSVRRGELVVVCGPVGAGKSTLIEAVLGEVACVRGAGVRVRGGSRLAYCAQQPWIQAGTVRDNVLFARAEGLLDPDRYDRAVAACALTHDLERLEQGDLTPIGELGVNLSGGQRARVALARAVYADADLYLLDDVLSAVDAEVSKHLFHQCILGALRDAGKAVVLVTHQIQYLPLATRVLLLDKEGRMVDCAPWDELKARVPDWHAFVEEDEEGGEGGNEEEEEVGKGVLDEAAVNGKEKEGNGTVAAAVAPSNGTSDAAPAVATPLPTPLPTLNEQTRPRKAPAGKKKEESRYILKEERASGGVAGETYLNYLRSGGVGRGVAVAALLIVAQAALCAADFWLKIWASSSSQRRDFYPYVYAGLMGVVVVLGFARAYLFFRFALRASTQLHDKALGAVLAAPLSFFHSNPRGRILNKFSKDLDAADDMVPYALYDFLQSGLLCLAAIVVGCIAVPYLLLLAAPLAYAFAYYRRAFVRTAREVKRLDAISRSPMFAEVSASLVGAKTVRAFRAAPFMERKFLRLMDENAKTNYLFLVLSRWLGFRLDALSFVFLTVLALLSVVLRSSIDTGLLALALTYSISLSGMFQWAIRQSAQAETFLTSVERLHHYTTLPAEGEARNPSYRPPPGWPDRGEIQVQDLHVRYREDLPVVLRGVGFTIAAGRKVGVVGRTGSGKSSFLAALLRLNEIVGGDIVVDGVSLTRLGLADARGGVAWIPQQPDLFAGTLRFNLDPFDKHSDAEIWRALEDVQLKGMATSLDMPVSEGGGNLSTGQRQLLSLARAVLLRRRVLLMDEATANVDYLCDQMIQTTIRTAPAFRGCTLVVIAHRINTVLDSDAIIVFHDGRCVEQGTPQELLADPASRFAAMVREAEGGGRGAAAAAAKASSYSSLPFLASPATMTTTKTTI